MSNIVVSIALAAVGLVLLWGFINMLRGSNSNLSQTLMRWRVGLQFIAIALMIGVMWWNS